MQEPSSSKSKKLLICCDTIVESRDGRILEKPVDREENENMIRALSGSYQQVHSGLALYLVEGSDSSLVFEGVDSTKVHFQTLTEADVSAYVDTGEGVDKAGGYGIQGIAGQLVDSIEGSFSSVVGLPVHVLSREIASLVHNGKL